ncbi:MAG: sulfurtransferase TusA family protein [Rhizomicrobium sp.]
MNEVLDLRGLKCPLPALFAKRALLGAPRGAAIEIVTDDPLAVLDVPHMCRHENFDVVSVRRDGDVARMVLRKP